jgi:hypothetical protein
MQTNRTDSCINFVSAAGTGRRVFDHVSNNERLTRQLPEELRLGFGCCSEHAVVALGYKFSIRLSRAVCQGPKMTDQMTTLNTGAPERTLDEG